MSNINPNGVTVYPAGAQSPITVHPTLDARFIVHPVVNEYIDAFLEAVQAAVAYRSPLAASLYARKLGQIALGILGREFSHICEDCGDIIPNKHRNKRNLCDYCWWDTELSTLDEIPSYVGRG